MPKLKITEKEIYALYNEYMRYGPKTALTKNPKFLILIRYSLGLSQNSFEKMIGMNRNISKYEREKLKKCKEKQLKR